MDELLRAAETHVLAPYVYGVNSTWAENGIERQAISLFLVMWALAMFNYVALSGFCYTFLFDKRLEQHPK